MITIKRKVERLPGSPTSRLGSFLDRAPSHGAVQSTKTAVRAAIMNYIRDLNRMRVMLGSAGAGGTSLEGYSTRPLRISYPSKRKRIIKPVGGIVVRGGMFFPGGYKQYKEATGQVSDRFTFFNTGDAWKDWKVLTYGSNAGSPGKIGFTRVENAIAANSAILRRPLLFQLDKDELSMVNDRVLSLVNKLFIPS